MRIKRVVSVLVLILVGAVVYLQTDDRPDRNEVEALARIQSRRSHQREASRLSDQVAAFEALARAGKAQIVPKDLVVEPDPGGFWFIGKRDHDVGVEIPFAPGRLRTPPPDLEPVNENPGFVGPDACKSCHQEKYASFVHTAHYRTSRPASAESIAGSFAAGKNVVKSYHPDVYFKMVERDGTFYQRVSFFDWKFEVPSDIVIGSSKIAQSFLYWHGDALYQMNLTYLSGIDDWINSPGYIDGDAAYARPIPARCVECHSTYADFRGAPNHFTPNSLIFGVTCERCHGPGRDHVEYHTSHPDERKPKFVVVPTNLTREQELSICAQCHSSVAELKHQPYQFRPGDLYSDHYHPADEKSGNSVHTSNQILRMSNSECFKQSEMTCLDCHNPHQNERGDRALFSARCMKCHDDQQCGMGDHLGDRLRENCIDCHMPIRATENLRLDSAEGSVFPPLRDHYVRIDRLATETYLKSLNAAQSEQDSNRGNDAGGGKQ